MKCPVDGTVLQMSDRQGVEIDYCPQCRGVWLDRGELDKILERAGSESSHHEPARAQEHHREEHRSHDDEYKHKKHKKEGFLGDIFDF